MRKTMFFIFLIFILYASQANGALTTSPTNKSTSTSSMWFSAAYLTSSNLFKMNGASLEFGYKWKLIGMDLKFLTAGTKYGSIAVQPSPSDLSTTGYASKDDTSSEQNRQRRTSDPWMFTALEPGLSITGRLFVNTLPRLAQKARVGIGYASFTDDSNSVNFSGYYISSDAYLIYYLGANNSWSITTSLGYRAGTIQNHSAESGPLGRLPVSWLNYAIGAAVWF
ncbi:MAG: hypothetical protein AABZ06_09415 [Bdellovibrionota bacterium]